MLQVHEPELVEDVYYQSITIDHHGETLHLQRIFCVETGPAVFMLHGSLGNGRVFYSLTGKGLAPYLARQGYDTYIGDLRGRGRSRPSIGPKSEYGQTESITEEIPAFHKAIDELRPQTPIYWAAHSWGGALLVSYLARFPERAEQIKAGAFFGSKRVIHRDTFLKLFGLTPMWDFLGRALVWFRGYLSGHWIGFSDDCESRRSFHQTAIWLGGGEWRDPGDGFDYQAAVQELEAPPILHCCGARDTVLGAASDVRKFVQEYGCDRAEVALVGKAQGHLRDYGHLDILIHPDGPRDQFALVTDWFKKWE